MCCRYRAAQPRLPPRSCVKPVFVPRVLGVSKPSQLLAQLEAGRIEVLAICLGQPPDEPWKIVSVMCQTLPHLKNLVLFGYFPRRLMLLCCHAQSWRSLCAISVSQANMLQSSSSSASPSECSVTARWFMQCNGAVALSCNGVDGAFISAHASLRNGG
jgi:hypothetical protein